MESSKEEMIKNIEAREFSYQNLFELKEGRYIKFKLDKETFRGTLIHRAILGEKIRIDEHLDGLVKDKDDIFLVID